MLLSYPTPSLIGGVSQQPSGLRFDSQAISMENCWVSPVDGLTKRWASSHIAKLFDTPRADPTLHMVNRDINERYVMAMGPKRARFFDLSGAEVPIFGPLGVPVDFSYLDTSATTRNLVGAPETLDPADDAAWGNLDITLSDSGVVDPWDQFDAQLLTNDNATLSYLLYQPAQATLKEGGVQTFSAYVYVPASNPCSQVQLVLQDSSNSNVARCTFDTALGTVVAGGDPTTTVAVVDVGNSDWKQISLSVTTGDGTGTTIGPEHGQNLFIELPAGESGNGIIVWGVQLQQGVSVAPTYFPAQSFKALTVADSTFILNKTVVPTMDGSVAPSNSQYGEGFIFLKAANACVDYRLRIETDVSTYEVSAWTRGTRIDNAGASTACGTIGYENGEILDDLMDKIILATPDLTVTDVTYTGGGGSGSGLGGPILHIEGTATEQLLKIEAWNDKTQDYVIGFTTEVRRLSDLSEWGLHGYTVHVTGAQEDTIDDYYVRFVGRDAASTDLQLGHWEETVGPGVEATIDPTTMPHRFVRREDNADGDITGTPYGIWFEFDSIDWDDRLVGDAGTNPAPTFIEEAHTIEDIFFHGNRLGFLSQEHVALSEVGVYFNLFRTSTTAGVLDSDPLDAGAAQTSVTLLRHAVSHENSLILFSDRAQFVVEGNPTLTPKTVEIVPVFHFETYTGAEPESVGRGILFPYKRGDFSGVREIIRDSEEFVDIDTTAQVPAYLPGEALEIHGSSLEDVACVLMDGKTDSVYVYKWYWQGREKVQSSWHKWTFGDDATVLALDFIENTLFLVIQRTDGIYLESVPVSTNLQDPGLDFQIRLDRRAAPVSAVYDGSSDTTLVTFPYDVDAGRDPMVVDLDTGVPANITGRPSGSTANFEGDLSGLSLVCGQLYDMRYKFSEIELREQSPNGGQSQVQGRLSLRQGILQYVDSSYFQVSVTARNKATKTYTFSTPIGAMYALGGVSVEDGDFKFPILQVSDRVDIEVHSTSPLPVRLMSAEWETKFSNRASRAGR